MKNCLFILKIYLKLQQQLVKKYEFLECVIVKQKDPISKRQILKSIIGLPFYYTIEYNIYHNDMFKIYYSVRKIDPC